MDVEVEYAVFNHIDWKMSDARGTVVLVDSEGNVSAELCGEHSDFAAVVRDRELMARAYRVLNAAGLEAQLRSVLSAMQHAEIPYGVCGEPLAEVYAAAELFLYRLDHRLL